MDPMQNPEEREEMRFGEGIPRGEEGIQSAWKKTQEGIRSMKEQASQSLESARLRLADSARNTLVEQKDKSVAGLQRISSVIHEAAAKLNEEGDHTLAQYTETLGVQVEKAAEYLKSRDAGTVLRDFEGFARRQAGLVIGGMFVTGLIVGRLIQSSRQSEFRGASTLRPGEPESESENAAPPPPAPSPTTTQPGTIPPSSRFGTQGLGPLEP